MSEPAIDRQRQALLLQATLAFAASLGEGEDLYRWKLAVRWLPAQPWPPDIETLGAVLDELGLGRFRAALWRAAIEAL